MDYSNPDYHEREFERRYAHRVNIIARALGIWRASPGWEHPRNATTDSEHWWLLGRKPGKQKHNKKYWCQLVFKNRRFSADSELIEHKDREIVSVQAGYRTNDDFLDVIKNDTSRDWERSYERKIGQTRKVSNKLFATMSSSVESEVRAKAGGDAYGGSVEAALKVSFGLEAGWERTQDRDDSNEETKTLTVYPAAGKVTTVQAEKTRTVTTTPWTARGIRDFHLSLDPSRGSASRWFRYDHFVDFDSHHAWLSFLHGYDTRFPAMRGFRKDAPKDARDAMAWMEDPQNRYVDLSGERVKVWDTGAQLSGHERPIHPEGS